MGRWRERRKDPAKCGPRMREVGTGTVWVRAVGGVL